MPASFYSLVDVLPVIDSRRDALRPYAVTKESLEALNTPKAWSHEHGPMRPFAGSDWSTSRGGSIRHKNDDDTTHQSPFKNTRLQSVKPGPSLKEARQQSTRNLQLAFESIFERYRSNGNHALKGKDDVYDLETGEIVEDHGGADDDRTFEIGDFGLPGAMGQDDRSSDDGEDGQAADSSASEAEADKKPRNRSLKREDSIIQPFDLDADSTSEEEFAQWSGHVGDVSLVYKQEKRVREELQGDFSDFMREEANLQAKASNTASPITPRQRIKKSESVMPVDFAASSTSSSKLATTRAGTRSAPAHLGRCISAPSVKPESKPSSPFLRSFTPQSPPVSSSTAARTVSRRGHTQAAAIQLGIGNTVWNQAAACDSDSSDDELSILSPLDLGVGEVPKQSKATVKRESSISPRSRQIRKGKDEKSEGLEEYKLPTPPPSRTGQLISGRKSPESKARSIKSATPRLEAVVEIFGSTRSNRVASIKPFKVSPPRNATVPRRSSPLKNSSIIASAPVSPPASRSSKASSMPSLTPDLDQEEQSSSEQSEDDNIELDRAKTTQQKAISSRPSPKKRTKRSPAFSPELEDVSLRSFRRSPTKQATPSSFLSNLSIKSSPAPVFLPPSPPRSNVTDPSYYFGDEPPKASTSSSSSSAPTRQSPAVRGSSDSGKTARRPTISSQASENARAGNRGKSRSAEEDVEDVFKVPSPPRPNTSPRSPRKRIIESSSSSEGEKETSSPPRNAASSPKRAEDSLMTPAWRSPAGVRANSVMSLSRERRRRLGSVIRQSVVPPDDESDESDDPLGI